MTVLRTCAYNNYLNFYSSRFIKRLFVFIVIFGFTAILPIYIISTSTNSYQYYPECNCYRNFPKWSFYPLKILSSTCSDQSTWYKKNQNVVSFSLYFDSPKQSAIYSEGIQLNLEKIQKFYPNYTMRIYTNTNPSEKICELICSNQNLFWCDIRKVPEHGDLSVMHPMTWRFLALGDSTVNVFLSRDLDSVVTSREAAAVNEWLYLLFEKKPIHVMRDKQFAHKIEMLGGLWGAQNSLLGYSTARNIQREIVRLATMVPKTKGWDQFVIVKEVYYKYLNHIVAYDSYHCVTYNQTKSRGFPVQRQNVSRDGETEDFVGNSGMGRAKYLFTKCPIECRPKHGKNWQYC